MARFCSRCGSELDKNGQCPHCDGTHPKRESTWRTAGDLNLSDSTTPPEAPPPKKPDKRGAKQKKRVEKRAALTKKQKVKRFFVKLSLILLVLVVLSTGILFALTYFDVLELPEVSGLMKEEQSDSKVLQILEDIESNPDSYGITPPDAQAYFEENSEILGVVDVNESDSVPTEAEVYDDFRKRGFDEYSITEEYSMNGEYHEACTISDSSSEQHPIYEAYYVNGSGEIWNIHLINGDVMASPISYNFQDGIKVKIVLSESDSVTSYDSTTNKFYKTIPDKSVLSVKTVKQIDAETLERMTIDEMGEIG